MKVGLYFGTFNPIHIGHMVIANFMVEFTEINQLWFVVSPQSPFKQKHSMLSDYQRLELVNLAIDDDLRFRASNVEFNLPKPSYTIDTLTYLSDQYPQHEFYILMGSDNLTHFHKWKNYEQIINHHHVIVYPRPGFDESNYQKHERIQIAYDAPQMDISSTKIREAIREGKNMRHWLPAKAFQYIDEMNFYKK